MQGKPHADADLFDPARFADAGTAGAHA